MSTFTAEGRLFLIDTDRQITSVRCTITLRKPSQRGRGEWRGTFTITGDQREFQRVHLQESEFILRLSDGREGRIIVTNVPVTPEGVRTVSFQGSGPLE